MSSHIQKSCVGLEATLSDSKKKYGDKVNALLSAWEHVTNFIPAASPDTIKALIEWAHKHTLKLVLRGEWPKLQNATKTHLSVTLKRCAENLENHLASRCTTLVDLVHNPWSNPALEKILNGQPDGENEEAFCCSEKGELLTMRLKILCEDRCEDIAVNLAAACVRSLRRSEALRSASEVHHVQYMFDVYIVLLFKLKRTQDIFAQLTLMDLEDGLELVQRLSGEKPIKYGKARVWKNSTKAAELVVQYLVTVGMVRPVSETGANVLEQILNSWALLHSKLKETASTLPGMIRKLIEPAESAQHIYILCTVLMKHFGGTVKPLVIELYIRALTTDMNELESQKTKADKEKARETAKRLSVQFLKLADFVVSNIGIARECVLTAFSLNPTRECYDRIKEIAIACGKIKKEINENGEDEEIKRFQNMSNSSLNDVNEKKDVIDFSATTNLDTNMGKSTLSSMCASTTAQNIRKNIEFQSGTSKSFQHTDEILKTILTSSLNSEGLKLEKCTLHPKRDPSLNGPIGELCFNCGEFTGIEATPPSPETNNIERTLDALILIKGDAVTGSANYDEKTVPNQVLDAEKLGLSPQLCDDLAVVLSSPRYHMLSWVLDWNELNTLCERYLENAEEMRNTNKELKYLNIDYSQFKDWPSEDESKDEFFGIEKGYEQWADIPSDSSEQYGSFQPAGNYKRTTARRSLDDTTDSESESVVQVRRRGRPRKVHPVVSSESDYDSTENKPKHFRNRTLSVSDSDTNTQDSQTDSLGSDGFRPDAKKSNKPCVKENSKKHGKSKLTVETVSHFHMLVNEAIRHPAEDVSGSDVSSNDIITLFSADLDENKRETIKGSTYTAAAPLIITEKRSDPDVLKSLRMFRPKNSKKPRISQILQKNLLNKSKDNNNINDNSNSPTKYAPMLSTLNLNPKIVLTRTDDVQGKRKPTKKQFNRNDLTTKLINIQKTMPFHQNKNSIVTYQKQRNGRINSNAGSVDGRERVCSVKSNLGKTKFDILAQAVRDSDILAKNVPGLNSLDMMIPPRIQSTVNVVQLSRNIPPSPSTVSGNSGNTPPRNRTSSNTGNIQLPGTPSSGGHDSGVGMSPAGQTPPPRSSSMHDVGDEANQPPDASPTDSINASTLETDSPRTINNQRSGQSQSPKKSPSPSTTTATTVPIGSEQIQIVCKPDGTYQLASVNPNILTNQRSVLALQNLDDGTVGFSRNVVNRNTFDRLAPIKTTSQAGHNTGLPKFQHAFGKTIYTLSTDTTTVAASSTTETLTQPTTIQKASNLSKAVQTSVPSTQANTASLSIQSIAGVQNLQLSSGRQILNIVQSSTASSTNTTTPTVTQTLTQLVQNMHNASSGVIYTHKIPVTISTTNPSQLNIIPTITPANSLTGNRTPVVKLNIIRAPIRQQNIGTIQAVLATPRMPQPTVRPETTLINTPIDVPNQVSSTTLEQLREFESVLEQVKERSTIQPQNQNTTTTTVQTQTQTAPSPQLTPTKPVSTLTQQLLIPSQTPNSSKFSNGNTVTFPDSFSQKVSLAYVNQTSTPPKVTNSTPVVVVTSYCQPAASPALSVTSQSSSSPCVTPAPAPIQSSGKTPPTASPKSSKKSTPKTVKTSATNTAKASPIPKPQQKPQEDEKTAQRIYAILTQYAEQLRNSPDLNNKPAPRRRSNPPTNPSQSSKRKKSSSGKSKSSGQQSSELSPSAEDLGRTMGSEDSSSGIAQVQDSPAGFTTPDEPSTASNANDATDNRTNDSNDGVEQLNNIKRRNLIFTEPNASGGQRAVIVQESGSVSVSEALASVTGKMGSTAVLMSEPGTTTMTSVSKQVSNLDNTSQFLITGGPSSSDSQQSPIRQSIDSIDSSGKIGNGILCGNARLQEAWEPDRKPSPDTPWRYVPTSTNSLNIEPYKISSRDSESTENVLQIINKNQTIELSSGNVFQPNAKKYFINHSLETYQQYSNKNSLAKSHPSQRELLQQRAERKNAALERELKLQKSLSEECEDLGVDEPSTSDLFPEADLLFDNNHSPSFDHSSQDATCSQSLGIKPYCSSYFRSLDSSSGSRDASPIADLKANERRRNVVQRTRTLKDTVKRAKREKVDELHVISPVKHMRLSLDNLSQDDASNSNSDLSRLSPGNIPSTENDSSKDNTTSRVKLNSRRGSKEGTPSSLSSTPSNIKLDIDIDTQSLPAAEVNTNNTSITSSGDESLTLLGANTADVTITSPLSPIAGPLLSTHKYTYSNKKRVTTKIAGSKTGYLSWESPMSERTRSSSEDDDSSISDSLNSQPEDNTLMTNGLDDSMLRTTSNVKITSDHCTYLKAKDKLHVTARVVLNRADPKHMLAKRFKSDSISETNVVVTSDKTSEASDDETSHNTSVEPDCRARRSSLRGHVKKGCACCNGSPERPKKKPVKLDHKLKKRLSSSKQLGKKR
ncbi:uncharacterized protein LOC127285478 isoform X3 [Leptopilina boulardi]|uniref:uncharacterized protein LOC127285478 isoform X3 n=1 Tax=Leptopilina boulardi TaxID=63433 RepID=UPI0021F51AAD|nr:uncharacterized protein LOC127285478 isoform X3 [Leptopilina boulardi]